MSVLVVVPVLDRPEAAAPLAESLAASAGDVELKLMFVATPEDDREIDALEPLCKAPGLDGLASIGYGVVGWPAGPGDWAKKLNWAYQMTDEEWLFTGADDLAFRPGWADAALACAKATGAGVVGTNDLGNPRVMRGNTATHNLVARWYADAKGTIDGPARLVSEVYDHNFVDDELVTTAKARRAWTFCRDAEVEHLHPHWGKGETDSTYEKGQERFHADRTLYLRRRAHMMRAR